MKHIGKWIFILSTIFCAFIVIYGTAEFDTRYPNRPEGDVPIGAGAGVIIWFILWCLTALPGLYFYWSNSRREKEAIKAENQIGQESSKKQSSQENKPLGDQAKGCLIFLVISLGLIVLGVVLI